MYAVVDIETTGGSPKFEKITEIAVYLFDGNRIVDEFATLINPERLIPSHISALTGITNEMVADAPKFYEIAADLIRVTENCIFVAHNVTFDYSFIKNEFRSLGYIYQREHICTVQLSRKLIPGLRSYSLGNLCHELGITINHRHRAAGDALATTRLLEILINNNNASGMRMFDTLDSKLRKLNPGLDVQTVKNLPEEAGVYYFYNDRNDIIYIGKSKNIKTRVLSHLSNLSSKRAIEMVQRLTSINYELTGSELIALLLESSEIKKHKPLYNRAQRRSLFQYGLYSFYDALGYLNFEIRQNKADESVPLYSFGSKKEALNYVNSNLEKYRLCQKYCGIYKGQGACFHYELMECLGACTGKEPAGEYNKRAGLWLKSLTLENRNMILIDKGRETNEYSVVKIENGKYIGFGFIDQTVAVTNAEQIDNYIVKHNDNHEIQSIIRNYLQNHRVLKKIEY